MAVEGAGSVEKSGVPFKRPRGHPRADAQEQVKILFWFWNGLELCVVECTGMAGDSAGGTMPSTGEWPKLHHPHGNRAG